MAATVLLRGYSSGESLTLLLYPMAGGVPDRSNAVNGEGDDMPAVEGNGKIYAADVDATPATYWADCVFADGDSYAVGVVHVIDGQVCEIADQAEYLEAIKKQTDQLDFSGAAGMLKSESTNMRGTDDALLAANYVTPDNDGIGDAASAAEAVAGALAVLTEDADGLRFTEKALEEAPTGGGGANEEAIAHAVWELAGKIDGKTPQQALRYIASVASGLLPTGAGSGTEEFLGLDQSTPRVRFTVDEDGNRVAVEYDPT